MENNTYGNASAPAAPEMPQAERPDVNAQPAAPEIPQAERLDINAQPAAPRMPAPGSVPPGGSYPAPDAPPVYPPPPPEKKARRVGTITMALCLVAAGVLLVLRVLLPDALDYWLIVRLSPVVLVFLGVEMLVAAARHKNDKLRFDVLSVFVSLLLIGASMTATVIPEVIHREVEGGRVGQRLAAELEAETDALLKQHPELPVYNVEWYVNVDTGTFTDDMTPDQLRAEHYVQVRVFMPGGYKQAAAFARDCRAVLDLLQSQVPHMNYASLYGSRFGGDSYEGDVTFSLWVDNRYQMDASAARLADMAVTNYWHGDYYDQEPPEEAPPEDEEAPPEDEEAPPEEMDIIDSPAA